MRRTVSPGFRGGRLNVDIYGNDIFNRRRHRARYAGANTRVGQTYHNLGMDSSSRKTPRLGTSPHQALNAVGAIFKFRQWDRYLI